MNYKIAVRMHKNYYTIAMNWVDWSPFNQNDEYTIFEILSYIPANIVYYTVYQFLKGIWWLISHRPKFVVAKRPTSLQLKVGEKQDEQ
jgi:hypothetical protein